MSESAQNDVRAFDPIPGDTSTSIQLTARQFTEQPVDRSHTAPKRIVAVSGDESFLSATGRFLESEDFVVFRCASLQGAFEAFPGSPSIDLLLVDLSAMGRPGFQLAAEFSRQRAGLRVVLAGPRARRSAMESVRRCGWAYLEQPVRLQELLGVIQHAFLAAEPTRASRPPGARIIRFYRPIRLAAR
jgi:DNA-binding NtrC family response regulator